ncbi:MAG: C39 family peptidase [Lachnospiraceae bacterium]|nr:C39 family peptidase [Lachnospiraceae bacterium]
MRKRNDEPGTDAKYLKGPWIVGAALFISLGIYVTGASASENASADRNVTETAAESEEGLLSQEDVFLSELTAKTDGTKEDASGEETKEGTVQAEEETDLLNDFVSRYGTVVPKDLSDEECIQALADLAEQYPEFESIYENREEYPMKLLIALCNNPEMVDFVNGYLEADRSAAGVLTQAEVNREFPYYVQWDERWGYMDYGESCLGLAGCGPTCLSMVIVALTRNAEASPAVVGEFVMENGYYMNGTGTMWALMTDGAAEFGVIGKELLTTTSEEKLLELLEEGYPVICSVKAGDFTKGGHFIVLAGVEDGQIRVHDPNSVERSSRLWDYETLRKQIKKMWVFEAAS